MSPRTIVLLPLTILLLMLAGPLAGWAAAFQTKAPYAVLVDYNTGAVLFEKNADALMAPASTTKILTAEIVFREITEGRLKLGDRMAISPRAAREGDAESGGSSRIAQVKPQVSVEELLCGVLITSGNDDAIALADGRAGSEDTLVTR